MRLYHSRFWADTATISRREISGFSTILIKVFICAVLIMTLVGCNPVEAPKAEITVFITADGSHFEVKVPGGSTVQQAFSAARITLGSLDRSEPPLYFVLTDGARVSLVRVEEEFEMIEEVIPFERQVLRNESMPEGETRLVQPGVNGLQEVTYRRVIEDGIDISSSSVKSLVIKEAVPEIMMVGSQAPFASFPIPGRLAYLLGGSAWIIDGNTGNRRPVVSTGDLDGRVFSLSPDRKWLLFSRRSDGEDGAINSLWVAELDDDPGKEQKMIDLNVFNVVHFADWRPGSSYTIAYSTVEPRASAPGWQANNDLSLLTLSSSGQVKHLPAELETNMGGTYGWWGMTFAWAPDGSRLAYARPDSVGLLDLGKGELSALLEIVALQTRGDWAWVPDISWSPDGRVFYTVDHVPPRGAASPEESPFFDVTAIPLEGGAPLHLASQAGMFAYPLLSPLQKISLGENASQVAFLQAIFPTQSESSRYHVVMMDRDGSNRKVIFPAEGSPGLTPQSGWGAWSPQPLETNGNYSLAVIYQDNLWIVEVGGEIARQITGNDLVSRVDWK